MFKNKKSKGLLVKDSDNRSVYDMTDEEIHELVDYLISISTAANISENTIDNINDDNSTSSDQTITLKNNALLEDNSSKEYEWTDEEEEDESTEKVEEIIKEQDKESKTQDHADLITLS